MLCVSDVSPEKGVMLSSATLFCPLRVAWKSFSWPLGYDLEECELLRSCSSRASPILEFCTLACRQHSFIRASCTRPSYTFYLSFPGQLPATFPSYQFHFVDSRVYLKCTPCTEHSHRTVSEEIRYSVWFTIMATHNIP